MKTSDLLVKCLETEGVSYVFGLPGEETADLMISLLNSTAKFILTRHEQSAAFMADVYGRLTGRVGALGPGHDLIVDMTRDLYLFRSLN